VRRGSLPLKNYNIVRKNNYNGIISRYTDKKMTTITIGPDDDNRTYYVHIDDIGAEKACLAWYNGEDLPRGYYGVFMQKDMVSGDLGYYDQRLIISRIEYKNILVEEMKEDGYK